MNTKKMLLATASFGALQLLSLANAAELPSQKAAAIPAALASYSWTGFYAGVLAGGATSNSDALLKFSTYTDVGSYNRNDPIGGAFGHIGFASDAAGTPWQSVYSQRYLALSSGLGIQNTLTYSHSAYQYAGGGACYYATCTSTSNAASPNGDTGTFAQAVNSGFSTNSKVQNSFSDRSTSGILGVELGYNKQISSVVFGVAADAFAFSAKARSAFQSQGSFNNGYGSTGSAWTDQGYYNYGNGDIQSGGTSSATGSANTVNSGESSFNQSVKAGPDWMGTARVSAGFAHDRLYTFMSGGLAFANLRLSALATYNDRASSTCTAVSSNNSNGSTSTSVNATCAGGSSNSSYEYRNSATWSAKRSSFSTGLALGGGFAYALSENTVAKIDALYYDFGNFDAVATGTATSTKTGSSAVSGTADSFTISKKINGAVARVGLAYKW